MAWGYVQGKVWVSVDGDGATAVMPGNTSSGNTMLVFLDHSYVGCPPSVTDSQGNTYTAKGTHPSPAAGHFSWVFTAPIGSSAACTLTIHMGCGLIYMGFAIEISGLASNPYDVENVNDNTANDCTTGSVTTSTDGQLVMSMFYGVSGSPTFTSAGGATTRLTMASNSILQTQTQATAGAVNPSATASLVDGSHHVYGSVATFKIAAVTGSLRRNSSLNGLGASGMFFHDPLASMAREARALWRLNQQRVTPRSSVSSPRTGICSRVSELNCYG